MKTAQEIINSYNEIDLWCDMENLRAIKKMLDNIKALEETDASLITEESYDYYQRLIFAERALVQ